MMDQPYLHFSGISKTFVNAQRVSYPAVENFDLHVRKGEFVSIIGHSGCGKSTVLMMAAGLCEVSIGGVLLEGRLKTEPGPDRAVVFQSPSLFPWLTALQNVYLGVDRVYPQASKKQRQDLCKYYLNKVGLGSDIHKKAADLSNGMKQRVGIARAFALKPKLLLLDEPFGMLDSLTRATLQEVLLEIWNTEKITALMVTHDVDEALFLSDRVVMMTSGPRAHIGDILPVPFQRPRHKTEVMAHPDYYTYREHLIWFLEKCDNKKKRVASGAKNTAGSETVAAVMAL